jgi:hypothetical protein
MKRSLLVLFLTGSFMVTAFSQINFPSNSTYRYLKGSQAASLGGDWVNTGFNDSGWSLGDAPFWYGDGTGGTELTDMINTYSTLYLRSTFVAVNAVNIREINCLIDYDDGFVIWINGLEALSVNAPPGYAYNGFAPENHESGVAENFTIFTNGLNLQEGTNTIAIQGFNVSLTSSDFHIECQMTATPETPVLPDTIGIGFNHPSGFYTSPFTLTLTSPDPGATLIYTLDGSNPQNSSTSYTGGTSATVTINPSSTTGRGTTPAVVVRASITKNGYQPSYPTGRTYIYLDRVRTQGYPGWDWPSDDVWGVSVPDDQPQVIDLEMDPDVVNDARYTNLIDDALLEIPTISIITDNKNLFDPVTGIYVNAKGDGHEWERECTVELINPDGSDGFCVNAGLRIRGGWSRHAYFPKHAFRLFFRSGYGNSKLEFPLFGDEGVSQFDKVDIRCEMNYAWSIGMSENSMVREVFSRDSQGAMKQPYTRSRYYHLFLNGMYWGLYQTQERSEARYAADYFGDHAADYDVIKVNTENYQIEATDGNTALWSKLYSLCGTGFENNEQYFALEGKNKYGKPVPGGEVLVDIDNLIDYMIGIFYSGNFDAPTSSFMSNKGCNNFYAIKDRNEKSKGFIFFNHDAEHSLFYYAHPPGVGINENRVNLAARTDGYKMEVNSFSIFHPQWLHYKLSANEEYRMRFADRAVMRLTGDGVFTVNENIVRFIDRVHQIDTAVIAESARWGDGQRDGQTPYTKDDNWLYEINHTVNSFFPARTNITITQLRNANLFPSLDAPVISRNGNDLYEQEYEIGSGWVIRIDNPNSTGVIYYTLNDTDPRKIGGSISSDAIDAGQGVTLTLSASAIIKARIYDNGEWSGLRYIKLFSMADDLSQLKITEIHYHPKDLIVGTDTTEGKDLEFMEFKNIGETSLNLSGIVVDSAVYYEFPANTLLGPGQFYVIVSKPSKFYDLYGKIGSGNFQGNLSNSGEEILIKDNHGTEIIHFTYDDHAPWPEMPDGDGPSLVSNEFNPTGEPSSPTYWRASYHDGGSPFADDLLNPNLTDPIAVGKKDRTILTFPNPTQGELHIQVNDNNSNETIVAKIYSLNGELLMESEFCQKTTLQLAAMNLSAGIYILTLNSDDWIQTQKIVFHP